MVVRREISHVSSSAYPEGGEAGRRRVNVGVGALKPWAQQVSPTVELTSLSQAHARLRLQGQW